MGILTPKSLDIILSSFNKTVKQLDAFVSEQEKAADAKLAKAHTLHLEKLSLEGDVRSHYGAIERANTVKEKIAALIS